MSISWPEAILHLDADAFFASVTQAVDSKLKGKPVVSGRERGIATAVSYEARALGVVRGMQCWRIKKEFPKVIITNSDYKLYHLFSKRMFSIINKYSPCVEIYSIDEGFADLKGLTKYLKTSYEQIGISIKNDIENSLGITVSIGISTTKSLAKIAANLNKPSGITIIPTQKRESFLKQIDVSKIWGIGRQNTVRLKRFNIKTAYDFSAQSENFIKKHFPKPFYEIWQELNGTSLFKVNPSLKKEYKSITKSHTVVPATNDKNILWARTLTHIEQAFLKARRYNYSVGRIYIFLKTQNFKYCGIEIQLSEKTPFPIMIRRRLHDAFEKIYKSNDLYRATGATIYGFSENNTTQQSLFFGNTKLKEKAEKIYPLYDSRKVNFGTILFEKTKELKKDRKLVIPNIKY